MKRTYAWMIWFFCLFLCVWTSGARGGTDSKRKLSLFFEAPKLGDSTSFGWLGGVGYQLYLGGLPVSFGPVGFFGSPSGGDLSSDNLALLGITLNADGYFAARTFAFRVGVDALYAQGSVGSLGLVNETKTWVFRPSVSIGAVVGDGWRFSGGAGYFYAPSQTYFNGLSFGIQIERKFQVQSKPAI